MSYLNYPLPEPPSTKSKMDSNFSKRFTTPRSIQTRTWSISSKWRSPMAVWRIWAAGVSTPDSEAASNWKNIQNFKLTGDSRSPLFSTCYLHSFKAVSPLKSRNLVCVWAWVLALCSVWVRSSFFKTSKPSYRMAKSKTKTSRQCFSCSIQVTAPLKWSLWCASRFSFASTWSVATACASKSTNRSTSYYRAKK